MKPELAEFVEEMKSHGLELTEDMAMKLIDGLAALVTKVVAATPNKFDDGLVLLLPQLVAALKEKADKIDGEVTPA